MTLIKTLIKKTRHKNANSKSITHLLQTKFDEIFKNENDKILFRFVFSAKTRFFLFCF